MTASEAFHDDGDDSVTQAVEQERVRQTPTNWLDRATGLMIVLYTRGSWRH